MTSSTALVAVAVGLMTTPAGMYRTTDLLVGRIPPARRVPLGGMPTGPGGVRWERGAGAAMIPDSTNIDVGPGGQLQRSLRLVLHVQVGDALAAV